MTPCHLGDVPENQLQTVVMECGGDLGHPGGSREISIELKMLLATRESHCSVNMRSLCILVKQDSFITLLYDFASHL